MAILRCHMNPALGIEALVTSWLIKRSVTKLPVPLMDSGRYIYGHAGTLYVMDITEDDAVTRFICQVAPKTRRRLKISPEKQSFLPEHAFVKSAPTSLNIISETIGESIPRIDVSLSRGVQVADGHPFTIPCVASAKPPPRFSWTKDDHVGNMPITTLSNAIGIDMQTSSELWVRGPILGCGRAKPSHEGSYTCIVANAKGSDRATFKVDVIEELRVSILPKHQTVSAGGRAVIRCTVYGSPVAEVRWYRNGMPLNPHSHILVQNREVIIVGANERDVGVYQCIAANSLGEAQGASYLTIQDSLPELTHKFIAQTLQPGPSVTLTCIALGHPTPSITWTQDGQAVSSHATTGRYSTSRISEGSWIDDNGQVVGQVNISSVSVIDGGLYQCEASNRVGRVTHRARLNVYGPPTSRTAANLTAINKHEAILPCPVAGFPLMDIQWLVDSRPLTPTLRRYAKADGTLHILEVDSTQDSKRFSCTATESRGRSASGSFFLSVLNPPILAQIKFPENLFEGMRLSILCTLLEGDVPISIRWSREGGARLPQDPNVSQSHAHFYSNLVFNKVQGRHAGEYTCTASNTAASTSVTAIMNVKVPPQWVVEPEDVQVVSGEDLNLECYSSGNPVPTVTWRRPHGDVSLTDSPEVISDGWRITLPRPGTLRIRSARMQDSGRYVCHSFNGVTPTLSKSIQVDILEGAKIDGRVGNETIGIGSRMALRCEVTGQLPIIYTWSQNGDRILAPTSDMGISLHEEADGRTSVLVLEKATRDHASVYTCQAANAYGADIKTFFINVVENPDPPVHVHVLRVTSRELSLAWAPPFDGNSPLTHYIVTSWIAGDRRGPSAFNTTLEATDTKAVIRGLKPGTQYHLNVLAVNGLGASIPSPTLSITTQMEPPTEPPADIAAKPSQRGALSISWQAPAGQSSSLHILGFQIGHRLERSTDDYTWRSVRAEMTSTEIRGLQHFTTYEITVRSVNEVGSGPMASPVKVTTSQAEPSKSPQDIECTPLASQSLRVRWNPVPSNESHGPVQGYKVYFRLLSNLKGSNRAQVKRTTNLETNLLNLRQYSNYSIRVLAFNAAGGGKLSPAIFCATLQDKPGPPESIKALTAGERSILVTWLKPMRINGQLTHFTLYYRPLNANQRISKIIVDQQISNPWEEFSQMVENLDYHSHYEFWVRGSTRVGEGPPSKVVGQSPGKKVISRIKSFGQVVEGISDHSLTLPCNVLGQPPPSVSWNPAALTLPDFSLRIASLHARHSGNYTCQARNVLGRDEQTWMVRVVSPPHSPTAHIQYTTENSIHLSWALKSDGGKAVTGYIVRYRETINDELDTSKMVEWHEEEIEQNERRYILQDMKCGTTYRIQVQAVNPIGRGDLSPIITTRTRGAVPPLPRSQDLITVNSTAVTLHLYTWPSGGCSILYFHVSYRQRSAEKFNSSVRLLGNTDTYTLRDLSPLHWHDVKVVAYNTAGSSAVSYQIATPSSTGVTLAPELVVEVQQVGLQVPPYLDPHVLAPIVSGVACTLALLLCVAIGISRGSCFSRSGGPNDTMKASESNGALFFQRRRDSSEDLSLAARAKQNEAYGVAETSYEICPYATFHLPPMGDLFPGSPSENPDQDLTLDYSLQFQTFGHHECLEGQHPVSLSPGGEIRCTSSDQTLPVGSALPRITKQNTSMSQEENNQCSDSDQDVTSESAQPYSRGSDAYRIPIKLKRGADFSFHPPDSSTESNDERSPQPPRRPPPLHHLAFVQQKPDAIKPHRVIHQQSRRQNSQTFAPTNPAKRTHTFGSIYTVGGTVCDPAIKSGHSGTPLMPPTGFLDSREISERECDRENVQGRKRKNNRGNNALKIRRAFSPPSVPNTADYSIHV